MDLFIKTYYSGKIKLLERVKGIIENESLDKTEKERLILEILNTKGTLELLTARDRNIGFKNMLHVLALGEEPEGVLSLPDSLKGYINPIAMFISDSPDIQEWFCQNIRENANKVDEDGKTPLDYAIESYLESSGAEGYQKKMNQIFSKIHVCNNKNGVGKEPIPLKWGGRKRGTQKHRKMRKTKTFRKRTCKKHCGKNNQKEKNNQKKKQ